MFEEVQREAKVGMQHAGMRLDQCIADLFPEYSRTRLKEWIVNGLVKVDGEVIATPRSKMIGTENVELNAKIEVEQDHQAQAIDLNIVYEDDDILVIDKPTNLVVHPGAGNQDGTILNALLHHVPDIAVVPRAGIVHRLDKDTTGLMVIAKNVPAHTNLVAQLQEREISREYEAIVVGRMVAGGTVDKPIGRHSTKRTLMAVKELGKEAVTHYRVAEKFREHTHLRLKLETGRTHQIRVHMAYIHHPLVGDPQYGSRLKLPKGAAPELVQQLQGFKRQALHAIQLGLFHPISGEWMSWHAPLPEDFVALRDALKADSDVHQDW